MDTIVLPYNFNSLKRRNILFEIWAILDYTKIKIDNHRLLMGYKYGTKDKFIHINLSNIYKRTNNSPINPEITEIIFSVEPFSFSFMPSLYMLKNGEYIIDETGKYLERKIDSIFPIKEILKFLLKFLNINLFDRYENYHPTQITETVDNQIEEYETSLNNLNNYKKTIKNHMQWKEKNESLIQDKIKEFKESKKQEILYFKNFKKEKFKKFFEEMQDEIIKINKINDIIEENFIIETMRFEKKIFSEIYNIETEKSEISKDVDIYNKKYINLATEIKTYFTNMYKFRNIEDEIKSYLVIINYNMQNFY